ncbi:MAG: hypothetical protein ABIS50_10685 [Luteolibacter sp.]|uniref:hypothetical protein n=1 Tax=Luteolibacter sp. TaxID=1962973 RepID=UPI003263E95D
MQRFKIEDLVVQDSSGVVFRAIDGETQLPVAVRRFFPFGPTGGGLSEDEQAVYAESVNRLSELSHPALRSIICGGCDPVDGMPYIATEWIEGKALQTFLKARPLSQPEAITVINQALEVCQILSEVMGAEGVWVETDLHTVIIGAEQTQRPVSFWISPLKWLGKNDGQLGLEPFIVLTTSIMGWTGKQVRELSSTGLGGWLKWLHGSARTATLHEAREMLAAAIGVEPPAPAKRVVRQATRPILAGKRKSKSKAPVWIFACTALLATGLGGWMLVRRNAALVAKAQERPTPVVRIVSAEKPSPPAAARAESKPAAVAKETPAVASIPGESREERANRMAAELTATARKSSQKADAKVAAIKQTIAAKGGVFSPSDHDLLLAQNKEEAIIEGTVESMAESKSGATKYLIFSGASGSSDFRGAISREDAVGELSESSLRSLSGKKIRLKGKIRLESVGSDKRPVIDIEKRNEIQPAE